MPENSKFNLMNLASHGRWDSYERFRSHRSGGIQGFGARARAPQQLPLNGQRLIPRQPGKWQKWQTGKTATMDAQGEGQISGNQTMDKRNRFEYEMRWDWHTTGGPKNGSCLWLTVGGLQLRSGSWNRRCPDSGSKSKWQSPRSRLIFQSMPAAVAVYLECANFQSRTSIFVWTLGGFEIPGMPSFMGKTRWIFRG